MKVLLIDGHALFRDGLSHILQQMPEGIGEILEAGTFSDSLTLAGQHPDLDLALLELKSPGSEGAISVRLFRQQYPYIPLMVVSSEEDCRTIVKALNHGASGYVCKSSGEKVLLSAVSLVLSGSVYVPAQVLQRPDASVTRKGNNEGSHYSDGNGNSLTTRQKEILNYLTTGLSNKGIARETGLTEGTVKAHIAAVYQTLRVKNRLEAIRFSKQHGLFDSQQA